MIAGEKSNDCLEGCRFPATDSLITFQNINSYRLEGVEMPYPKGKPAWNRGLRWSEEVRQKISKATKGRLSPMTDKHHSERTKLKISLSKKGQLLGIKRSQEIRQKISFTKKGVPSPLKGRTLSEETLSRMKTSAELRRGENHPHWNGGKKLAIARHRNNRRKKGFVLLTNSNPYNEPIEYHHIHPDLPCVVPCPTRIHQMFAGAEKTHHQNVNAMLGFRFENENQAKMALCMPESEEEIKDVEAEFRYNMKEEADNAQKLARQNTITRY